MAVTAEQIEQIKDVLGQMTVLQIAELTKALEQAWGVKAAPVAVAAAPTAGGAPAAQAAAEKTEFAVVLANSGANKIGVIKAIREITNLGLKEAKDLVDGAPKTIKEGASKTEADDIQKKLQAAGATVEIK